MDPFDHTTDFNVELLEDTFWCRLFANFGGMPILPRLKVVTILGTDRYHSIDTGPLRLLNPSIRELKIDFYYSFEKELKQARKALTVCFPSIQCLEALSVEVLDLTLVLDVETLPQLHPHLRYLKLYHPAAPIELSRLRALTALPNLESLNFHLSPWDSEPPNFPMTFPGLRSLCVSCSKFASIGVLLDCVNVPQLQALTIDELHQDSNNMIQIFPGYFRTLVTKCPWLTMLKWYSRQVWKKEMDYSGQWDSGGPLAELLAPLFSYRAMRHFTAVFEGPIVPYTPADFRAIAEALPDIETLRIGDEPYSDGSWAERHGDLDSVVAFASRCPSLRSPCLPVVQFDPFSARASELAHSTPTLHWLRELLVNRVTYPRVPDRRGQRNSPATLTAVELHTVMEKLFPIAAMRFR